MNSSKLLKLKKILVRGVALGLLLAICTGAGSAQAFGKFGDFPGVKNCANGQGETLLQVFTLGSVALAPGGAAGMQWGLFCYISVAVQLIILAILYAIGWLFSELLYAAAVATKWMINFSIDAATHEAVSKGFEATLQFANIIFVLALVVIAFATILRWHEYDARKLLPRLVIATLLVNFSLLFAGLLLDTSNVFTKYFVEKIQDEDIGKAFQPNKFVPGNDTYVDPTDNKVEKLQIGGGSHSWEAFFVLFPRTLFAILMTFFAFMAMLAAAMMALVRTVWVILLLIVMPLAWAMWVLPKYEHYWKTWWKNFLNWGVIYLPTVTFFIYLALVTANNESLGANSTLRQQTQSLSLIGLMFADAIRALIIIGILIGGLKIAQAMGAPIAGTVADMAGRGGKRIARIATKGAVLGMGGAAGATIGTIGGAGKLLGKIPGVGSRAAGLGAGLKEMGSDFTGKAKEIGKAFADIGKAVKDSKVGTVGKAIGSGASSIYGAMGAGSNLVEGAPRAIAAGVANALSRTGGIPVAGEFLTGLAGAASQYARNKKPLEEAGRRFDGLEGKDLERALKGVFSNPLSTLQDKAAALLYADKNHKLDALHGNEVAAADALAAMMPGIKRSKIGAIKNLAAHALPHDADGSLVGKISGETLTEVRNRANEFHMEVKDIPDFMARFGKDLTQQQINSIAAQSPGHQIALRGYLAGQAGNLLGDNGKAQLSAIEDTLKRIEELSKSRDKNKNDPRVLTDLNEAQDSYRRAVSELNRTLQGIDRNSPTWKDAEPLQKEAVELLSGIRRAVGTKDDGGHGSHTGRGAFAELADALWASLPKGVSGGGGGGGGHSSSGGGHSSGDSHGHAA